MQDDNSEGRAWQTSSPLFSGHLHVSCPVASAWAMGAPQCDSSPSIPPGPASGLELEGKGWIFGTCSTEPGLSAIFLSSLQPRKGKGSEKWEEDQNLSANVQAAFSTCLIFNMCLAAT